jgi:hypothetical protein
MEKTVQSHRLPKGLAESDGALRLVYLAEKEASVAFGLITETAGC